MSLIQIDCDDGTVFTVYCTGTTTAHDVCNSVLIMRSSTSDFDCNIRLILTVKLTNQRNSIILAGNALIEEFVRHNSPTRFELVGFKAHLKSKRKLSQEMSQLSSQLLSLSDQLAISSRSYVEHEPDLGRDIPIVDNSTRYRIAADSTSSTGQTVSQKYLSHSCDLKHLIMERLRDTTGLDQVTEEVQSKCPS